MQFCISTRSVNVKPVLIQVYGSAGTVTSADNCWGLCWACGGQLFGIRFEAERKILAETGATVRCAKVTDAIRCFVFGPQGGPEPEAAESLRCSCIKSLVAKDGTAHPQEIWQLSTLDTGYGSWELYFHRLVCACWPTCRGSQKHEQTIFLVILMVSDVHFIIWPGPLWTHGWLTIVTMGPLLGLHRTLRSSRQHPIPRWVWAGGRDKPYFCYKYSNNILGVFRRACG
jgi:hypothetical protein